MIKSLLLLMAYKILHYVQDDPEWPGQAKTRMTKKRMTKGERLTKPNRINEQRTSKK